jgi:hypothetical protein
MLSSIHQGGGIKPPVTHSSSSSFNFADMFSKALDPLGIFKRGQKTVEHFIDTSDKTLNKGIDVAGTLPIKQETLSII